MTTRPTVDWCVSTLVYLIGMSTLVDEAGLAGLPEQRLVMRDWRKKGEGKN